MDSQQDNRVLRTVFLSQELDDTIRNLAFANHIPRSELIVRLIKSGLAVEVANGLQTVPERIKARQEAEARAQDKATRANR